MPGSVSNKAFTLIELLIVVAIIAILAAIAVPNFLEAQTRAKVSRTMADMRSLTTALEAYRVDSNNYPPGTTNGPNTPFYSYLRRLVPLTTPVAFITSVPNDPFNLFGELTQPFPPNEVKAFDYFLVTDLDASVPTQIGEFNDQSGHLINAQYALRSWGPDLINGRFSGARQGVGPIPYDPTNGTVSFGDIKYFGPGVGYGL
jgi:type II secretion system protein G